MFERLRGYLKAENVLRRQIDASLAKVEKPQLPPEIEEGGLVDPFPYPKVDMYQGVQYDPRTLELQRQAYAPSITHLEDPRLKID